MIAINRTGELAPWADMLYGADIDFWRLDLKARDFAGEKRVAVNLGNAEWRVHGVCKYAADMGIEGLATVDEPGLSFDDQYVHSGGNSGYQALNIAVLRGARRVLLLGYDMGGANWHGKHREGLRTTQQRSYAKWRSAFEQAAADARDAGVEVVNCSLNSALECFEKARLADVL